mmetsp:Transcript_32202/g.66661  ORF Transcript_32202/g.66661 Transcript_32202/m.66661 type:complete len:95 (-) Transcript_32202:23-307(-)
MFLTVANVLNAYVQRRRQGVAARSERECVLCCVGCGVCVKVWHAQRERVCVLCCAGCGVWGVSVLCVCCVCVRAACVCVNCACVLGAVWVCCGC